MKQALELLQQQGYEFKQYQYTSANKSYIEGNTIYHKSITDGLALTFNTNLNKIEDNYQSVGIMLDVSRLKVYTVEKIKHLISYNAILGVNYITLYIEDLLSLPEYPAYGYLRGKYKDEEIVEIVEYAQKLGVEIIPAIQTLGHLEHFLKWQDSNSLKDTSQVLKVGADDTYRFLNILIAKCRKLFSSDKINIGMDEAFDLGFGTLYREGNTKSQKQLFTEHLDKVIEICKINKFEVIKMWSDMLFSVNSSKGAEELYNLDFDFEKLNKMSDDVEVIYWNYWTLDSNEYDSVLKAHMKFTDNVSMALGIHTWGLAFYNYDQLPITEACLKACHDNRISDLLYTMWGDDGSLYNLDSTLFGMYVTLAKTYNFELCPSDFKKMTGFDFEMMEKICTIYKFGIDPLAVIWNDPISNIYLKSISKDKLQQVLEKVKSTDRINEDIEPAKVYDHYLNIIEMSLQLYLEGDHQIISELIDELKSQFSLLENIWLREAKVNGLEEIQKRFITKIYRLEFLQKYQNSNLLIDSLNEDLGHEYNLSTFYRYVSDPTASRW